MKKIIAGILIALTSTALGALGLFWYATAKAELEVIANNAVFLKQQLYLHHYQLTFDYETLRIGSHYLLPEIVMTEPSLTFSTTGGIFRLKAPEISFIGGIGGYGEYKIRLPGKLVLTREGATTDITDLTVASFPEVRVKSSQPEESQEIENTILDQFLVERGVKLVLEVPLGEGKGNAKLVYTPKALMTSQWSKVRYQVYPYLSHFAQAVEKASGATRLP